MDTPEKEEPTAETATETAPEEKVIDMEAVYEIINSFPRKTRQFLIPMMSKIQDKFRFLPEEIVNVLMKELKITRAEIYGVISFYHQFRITEPGKYIFKLCYGTACFVKGAPIIADKMKEKYNIGQGETDASKLFTLEFASCLGNCGAAPMAIIGEDTYGTIDPEQTVEICSNYKL
ncbi:MAG: NAD(P)H-dependent oxidoreductase subunit E [Nitrospinaceae bacterium]|nr:NAD(P)H-dependent oxidoreductase subunit E [Nitrospinaceae bacterium]NIR54820.1 NAD(P)H-dependent oxidoreductase subunit E [Nitrospinaceae bacterium]NIS85245.1 NAD(P)H-dependent oxidoreductase subunit E [Nitrospinaceae bacterium]NIT82058.1 NAD(P)H-dependent oxidoreductase subunit E [Nitrospinaceae bacterium]NIU44319.1 NAD(P)H-dependent oxidoreductase subunit E [Nitrospinaceae bacterium]